MVSINRYDLFMMAEIVPLLIQRATSEILCRIRLVILSRPPFTTLLSEKLLRNYKKAKAVSLVNGENVKRTHNPRLK